MKADGPSFRGVHPECFSILSLIKAGDLKVEPISPNQISSNKIDLRIADEFIRLKNARAKVFDPNKRNKPETFFRSEKSVEFIIHPNERVLMCTIEKLELSNRIMGLVGLRSSFSRIGLQASVGFVDPGFQGQLTLEITGSSFPIRLRAEDRLFHIAFISMKPELESSYNGKYQNQHGPTLPKFP